MLILSCNAEASDSLRIRRDDEDREYGIQNESTHMIESIAMPPWPHDTSIERADESACDMREQRSSDSDAISLHSRL